mgnify:CR=1 FL=1
MLSQVLLTSGINVFDIEEKWITIFTKKIDLINERYSNFSWVEWNHDQSLLGRPSSLEISNIITEDVIIGTRNKTLLWSH